jgi:hypothetical protein
VKRITLVVTLLATALFGVTVAPPASASPEPRPEEVLVFGDSITAQHTDDPGDPMQGWWSILAAQRNLTPYISAQGGGAVLKPGFGCAGTGIRDRFEEVVERVRPDEIWIASGRNETSVCINGSSAAVNAGFRTMALNNFFAHVAEVADENGIPRDRVFVTTPWGTVNITQRHDIVIDMMQARNHGLNFINIPRLDDTLTRDGTHPNTAGSQYIAQTLAAGMPGPAEGPAPICTAP